MKLILFYSIFWISILDCNAQKKSEGTQIGIGFLETNTSFPIDMYKNGSDIVPFDTLEFNIRKDGTTEFKTKLKLKPYVISQGDSYDEGEKNINHGLIHFGPELKFRVIDSTKTHFKILTNEETNEIFYIKIEPHRAYYKTISEVHKNNCSNCPNSKYNPNWNVFETWERYLKRVEFIEKNELKKTTETKTERKKIKK